VLKEKETKIVTIVVGMMVTNMKYVINIKRKPSIIKEEKRRTHIWKKISCISLCVLRGTETSKMKTYINVSLVNVHFFLISSVYDFS
jgi:hypothetical protein